MADEEPQHSGNKMPEGVDTLLMNEKEYQDTLKRGIRVRHKPLIAQKVTTQTRCDNESRTNAEGNTLSMEDESKTPTKHQFWDRPIPKPQFDWPYNPRMPAEWNDVVRAMRAHEGTKRSPRGEVH